MQIKQLEYVREIVRQGSIKVAAEKLYISQQALSESMRALESELEFQLFRRTNRGIIPTEKCERILHDLDTIMPIIYSWSEYKEKPFVKLLVQYALSDLLVDARFMQYITMKKQVELQYETLNLANVLEETTKNVPCISLIIFREGTSYSAQLDMMRKSEQYIFEPFVEQKRSQMCILMRADSTVLKTGQIVDLSDLDGKTLVVNKDQIKLELVRQIIENTKRPVHGLPYTIKPADIVAQNQNAITFMPFFIAEENFYVKAGLLVACPIQQCIWDEWCTCLLYHAQWADQVTPLINDLKQIYQK